MKHQVGTVKELWRYPVKSMEGEQLEGAQIERAGLVGDRYWAVRDEEKNQISSVRRLPRLLQCSARYESEPESGQTGPDIPPVKITLPDGGSFSSADTDSNAMLSEYMGKAVSIRALQPKSDWKFYRLRTLDGEKSLKKQMNTQEDLPSLASISWLKILELSIFATPLGRFYDAFPLHIITSNAIAKLKSLESEGDFRAERFRPNIFIESKNKCASVDEFDWVGGKLYIGDVIVKCESKTVRCSMPAQPQRSFGKDSKILRTLEKYTSRHLGVNASVLRTGTINVGDTVFWEPEYRFSPRKIYQPISDRIKDAMIKASLKTIDRIKK